MSDDSVTVTSLSDIRIHVKLKLSALWASVMFCYIYGDFFGLLQPGKLEAIGSGKTPIGPTNQGILLGMAVLMTIPSVMIFLSLALGPKLSRWMNIVLGSIFTLIMLATMPGAWRFYLFLGGVEVALTVLIVWFAWRWPKQDAVGENATDHTARLRQKRQFP